MNKKDSAQFIQEYRRKERKEWRHVTREDAGPEFSHRRFPMFGNAPVGTAVWLSEGGWNGRSWMTTLELWKARDRWVASAYLASGPEFKQRLMEEGGAIQCGGCRFFGAFDADFGLCCNPESPMDGKVTFEHAGCDQHSRRTRC